MILEVLHTIIEDRPQAQIIKLSISQAEELYNYLAKYHLNKPPASFKDMVEKEKLFFMGRKIEVYE